MARMIVPRFDPDELPPEIRRLFDELPEEIKAIMLELAQRSDEGDGMTFEKLLEMPRHVADQELEDILNDKLEFGGSMDGIRVRVEVSKAGTAHKIAEKYIHKNGGVVLHMPQWMRDAIATNFANRFAEVGAEVVNMDWDRVNFFPIITWKYDGEEYHGAFYYDGQFYGSKDFTIEEPWEHNIETIVTDVAPRFVKRSNK